MDGEGAEQALRGAVRAPRRRRDGGDRVRAGQVLLDVLGRGGGGGNLGEGGVRGGIGIREKSTSEEENDTSTSSSENKENEDDEEDRSTYDEAVDEKTRRALLRAAQLRAAQRATSANELVVLLGRRGLRG